MSKKPSSTTCNTNNYLKNAREYIPDSEDAEINEIETIQKPKKLQKRSNQKRTILQIMES